MAEKAIAATQSDSARAEFTSIPDGKQVAQFFQNNFEKLDRDRSGEVSQAELRAFKPENENDRQALEFLKLHLGNLAKINIDNWFGDTDISLKDIQQFEIVQSPDYQDRLQRLQRAAQALNSRFDDIDKNKDGIVSERELEIASKDPALDAGAKYMVEFLKQTTAPSIRNRETGFSRADINAIPVNASFEQSAKSIKRANQIGLGGALLIAGITTVGVIPLGLPIVLGMGALMTVSVVGGAREQQIKLNNLDNRLRRTTFQIMDRLGRPEF